MSLIKKHFYIFTLILLFFIQGCATSTTKIYKAPYKIIEAELTNNFNIKLFSSNSDVIEITSNAEGGTEYTDLKSINLEMYLSNQFTVIEYIPGKKLVAKNEYYYNILGSGSHGVMFNIEKLTNNKTSVEVNYYDNGYLLYIIPIITLGEDEEKHIHKLLFKKYEVIQQ